MIELARETVRDNDGNAMFVVRVTVPDDVWRQRDGRPGFAEWAVYEVEAAWETFLSVLAPYSRLGPLFAVEGASSNMELTADFDEAERLAAGSVTWSGCTNWQAGTEGVLAHACDREGLRLALDAVALGYSLAFEQVAG